jgi:hypothetical protein
MQQASRAVPALVQELQCSTTQGDVGKQQAALQQLCNIAGSAADQGPNLLILQQQGSLEALQMLLDSSRSVVRSSTHSVGLSAVLLCYLTEAGELAAERITAEPGLLGALAGVLQHSTAPHAMMPVVGQAGQ